MWIASLFGTNLAGAAATAGERANYRLALPEASRLLTAVGPTVDGATMSSSAGLAGAADVIDLMDAQELIREGQAATAALMLNDGLVQLQLALQDGNERIITLFKQA